MKCPLNSYTLRWLGLVVFVLLLSGARLRASGTAEDQAFVAAFGAFSDRDWERATTKFAEFLKAYPTPTTEHYTDAVLLEAEALYKQGKYPAMMDLLAAHQSHADKAPDRFAYWAAEGHFHTNNFQSAVDLFAKVIRDYTNSPRRLDAILGEAASLSALAAWPRLIEQLGQSDGPFQQIAKVAIANDKEKVINANLIRGFLMLSEAQLAQKDYAAAEKTLQDLPSQRLLPESEWSRQYLLCRIQLADRHPELALQTTTNLLAAAAASGKPELQAQSIAMQATVYEEKDMLPAAISAYEQNLNSTVPSAWQRQALLKIVELNLKLKKLDEATLKLGDFLTKHTNEIGSDLALLTRGELRLRQYYEGMEGIPPGTGTNLLAQARSDFEKLTTDFPKSKFLGKAELNLGWCLLADGKVPESQAAFNLAIEKLPFSEDKAVALFKLADTLYQNKDFVGAAAQYKRIIDQFGSIAAVWNDLFERALYQIAWSGIEQGNQAMATNAMNKILEWFPNGLMAAPSMLLVGQGLNREGSPAKARECFVALTNKFPDWERLPEVGLAIARTYEQEGDWTNAIGQYDAWVGSHTNNSALPRAEFARAFANYQAGRETNAFSLFTNFVARFQMDPLAARAQYWVGDYYWRRDAFVEAEKSYEQVFQNTNWPVSDLTYQAQMLAGRAAYARQTSKDAIPYYTNLISDPKCPPDLYLKARFAQGDANMALSKYKEASGNFYEIANLRTNDSIVPLAWGRLADCYLQLGATDSAQYRAATNAYQQVMISPLADLPARSMAECGLALVLEKMARLEETPEGRTNLLKGAMDHDLNVVYGSNLRADESRDLFWVEQAGLHAGRLREELGQWEQAMKLYERLTNDLPPLHGMLERKISKTREKLLSEKTEP
ncbi:MAG: Tetratricopeptide domain protein [Pedosphaera sp.]|nr:Tetratricopeptide domain protein [Pedosphaera sp.]